MHIFNSLGSNYDFSFVSKCLFSLGERRDKAQLNSFLEQKYGGKSVLLYKGREAIKLAFEILNLPKGSRVGITGFTCFAVYQAVVEARCVPEYVDIENDTLNFSLAELKRHKGIKALIVQNTLGVPCNIEGILSFCRKNKIYLIEDLAHCLGIRYKTGQEVGTVGELTALSFSQDKMLDSVSGGALIIRSRSLQNKLGEVIFKSVGAKRQLIDRLYPLFTFLIRTTYGLGVGKALHYCLKKFELLSQSMTNDQKIEYHHLPEWYCSLAIYQFSRLNNLLKHKTKIASIYKKLLTDAVFAKMRTAIFVKNRDKVIKFLKKRGVHVSDIWYDAPIAPKRFLKMADYHGDCPVAENVSESILNLPTHINISEKSAIYISEKILEWQNSQ